MSETLLVTGAAGHLGRLVLDALLASNKVAPADIIATSRDPAKLAAYADKGVQTRRADFDDPASLATAFAGADRILVVSTDALDTPGKRQIQHTAAINAAKAAGAKHILYTSMPNPEHSAVTFAPEHLGSENAVKATGIPYTILRNGWYMENLFMGLPHAFAGGKWYSASGDGKIAHIARADMAAAIANAMLSASSESRTYTLTGPVARTTAEIAEIAAKAVGKPLEVVTVTDDQLAAGLAGAGLPPVLIPVIVSFDTNTREGKIAMVTDDAATLAGKPLTTLESFLEANKAAFAG
ncbi:MULTISPECIES: NmrA family NAD(P)-binding protein [unclassified Rhizobium]|uniref:NmrA family NAD(P)-binding protein n=1 Tax=unclassified Rhizobium TaxID=2613769 RepID=UPI000701F953|nr:MULTISPECIES: NmrA family NAD(P)-binding protein [unclassified Rhizobium]KQV34589.1 NAD(P)-dependent oxidoreductase [Rhizobium sp. Root1212]KRD23923.1 NAD(P)-dependent oxidoreductase [Rhizobium sp. Root268]